MGWASKVCTRTRVLMLTRGPQSTAYAHGRNRMVIPTPSCTQRSVAHRCQISL